MVLYLIRHGETDFNAGNLVQGWTESELNATGRWQAEMLAKRLTQPDERPTAIYCSPQSRAAETARPTAEALGIQPVYDDALMEMRCGDWEGLNFDQIKHERRDEFHAWARSADSCIPGGGESIRDLHRRAAKSADRIISSHPDGSRIAIFTHGGVNRVLMAHFLGIDLQVSRRCHQDNASISLFVRRLDMFFMDRWNDISHLVSGTDGRPLSQK